MFRELWLELERDFIGKDIQTGDVRIFVESCPVCQVEKSDHTLTCDQLQSTEIPEEKWQQVSIDFITDFPETSSGVDSIMPVIDKATRMTHVIPCSKTNHSSRDSTVVLEICGKTTWNP